MVIPPSYPSGLRRGAITGALAFRVLQQKVCDGRLPGIPGQTIIPCATIPEYVNYRAGNT